MNPKIHLFSFFRRFKKYIIGVAVFFVVFTLVGFFVLPPILKSILTRKLSENLHREVSIRQIKLNPYALSLTVRGFLIKDRNGPEPFVSFDELYINLQSLSAIKRAILIKEFRISRPFIKLVRNQDLSYNFSDLLEKKENVKEAKAEEKTKPAKPLNFSVNNIRIENGSVDFLDGTTEIKHTVKELNIAVPFVSNIPYQVEIFVEPTFSAKINETAYALQGKTKPFTDSLETSFDIDIRDLNIPYYLAYLPAKRNFRMDSGSMDIKAKLSFLQKKEKERSVTIQGDVTIKKVSLDDMKGNPILRLPALEISILSAEPFARKVHLSRILLQSPELNVERRPAGEMNIESLVSESKEKGGKPVPRKEERKEEPSSFSVEVDDIQLAGGKVSFSDLSRAKPFKTTMDPVEMKINQFSNGKEKKATYTLALKTEAKEKIDIAGQVSINPLLVEGTVKIDGIPLKKYSPYYQDRLLFGIEDGRLDLSSRYRYAQKEKEPEVFLSGAGISVSGLRLRKTGEEGDFLKIPGFSIKETEVDLNKKELRIGDLSTQKGELQLKRSANGDMNILNLFPPPAVQEGQPQGKAIQEEKSKKDEKPWLVLLKRMSLDQYTIRMEDRTPSQPVALTAENIKVRAENISTAKNSRGKLALSLLLDKKGTISTAGTVGIDPVLADLKIELKDLGIAAFQSYFTDKVKITLTKGAFSMAGNLAVSFSDKKEMKVTYKGDAAVSDFASIDKQNAEDFLKWDSLSFSQIQMGYAPMSVDIKGIALSNFYTRVIMNPNGTLNLQEIMNKEPVQEAKDSPPAPASQEGSSPPKEKEPARAIKIESVTLQGGRIDFSDRSIKPEYALKLTEIGGRVSGLSSEETTMADIELRGKFDDYAPLEITGKVNPLKEDLYVDLKVRFKDMDLSPVTPYSGKYVGYTIQKGKLSFDLSYNIVKRKLDSQNSIFLDQLTLGDKVESPTATKLPVKLALALLKDRRGEIKLDIPVKGSLDDPKFSVWGIIVKILVNLIAKAATSPFALLGAVLGGGEELSYLEFEYGSAAITEPSVKKIETLMKALHDRPGLKMDIEGHVDPERDREGLKQYLFDKKLKAQKLNEIVKAGQPVIPVDDVKIDPPDYAKYLKLAYKEEKFPKPRNILGIAKDLPAPEMEKLMLTHIEVKEGDLRALANQRAMRVKDAILKPGQVEPDRIFLIEPKSLAPEKKEKLKESRVDFKLK